MDWLFNLGADLSSASEPVVDMNSYITGEVWRATMYVGVIFLIIFFMTKYFLLGSKRVSNRKKR